MISPLLVASTGARTTLLALADTRRSWAPPTPTPRIPDQVVGVAPRSAPLQAAGAFDALLVCAPLVYSINKSLYGMKNAPARARLNWLALTDRDATVTALYS